MHQNTPNLHPKNSRALLDITRLHFKRGHHTIIPPLSLSIQSGDLWHIQGPNGSGKTTLLKLLAGLLSPTEGQIIRHTSCAYLGTSSPFPATWTLHEIFTHVQKMIRTSTSPSCTPDALLERFGVSTHWQHMKYGMLSSGQKKRFALMMTWMHHHPLMLLDEPFTTLDKEMTQQLWKEVHDFCVRGGAILFSHHGPLPESLEIKTHTLSLASMNGGA